MKSKKRDFISLFKRICFDTGRARKAPASDFMNCNGGPSTSSNIRWCIFPRSTAMLNIRSSVDSGVSVRFSLFFSSMASAEHARWQTPHPRHTDSSITARRFLFLPSGAAAASAGRSIIVIAFIGHIFSHLPQPVHSGAEIAAM